MVRCIYASRSHEFQPHAHGWRIHWQTRSGRTETMLRFRMKAASILDQHVAAFASTNASTVYVGNDGGVFLSSDGGSDYMAANVPIGDHPILWHWHRPDPERCNLRRHTGQRDAFRASGSDWQRILGGDGTTDASRSENFHDCLLRNSGCRRSLSEWPLPSGSSNIGLNTLIDSTVWLDPFAADQRTILSIGVASD